MDHNRDKTIDIKLLFSGFSKNSGTWNKVMHTSSEWVAFAPTSSTTWNLKSTEVNKHQAHRVTLPGNLNMFPRFIHMRELLRLLRVTWDNYLQIEEGRREKGKNVWHISEGVAQTGTDDVFPVCRNQHHTVGLCYEAVLADVYIKL